MNINSILKFIEGWAPPQIAWQKDNVGLQVGSLIGKTDNVLLCLEVTHEVISEAVKKKCNLIISHHPLLFSPLKIIDTDRDPISQLTELLLKNNLTLLSFHTNLDFTVDGVSYALAKKLELTNIRFLVNQKENQSKLVVFVPENAVDKVSAALFEEGAGKIGEYEKCSFRGIGTGTFRGSEFSNPTAGKKDVFETVEEIRLEVLIDDWNLGKAIAAIKTNHPYEEPAFDIYSLKNENLKYGFGALGTLKKPMSEKEFLTHVSQKLKTAVRFSSGKGKRISKVAVCGGSGSELLKEAVAKQADAFVTADIKYHAFHDANKKILLIDAGHYETEIHILPEIKLRLEKFLSLNKENSKVFLFGKTTNPINFFNN
ncbi:MAG: Nif3-like dinuclear metal center hexameric protein [Ignavibacteriaceae bacterium]|nr:Nif3-like dinuclear metal center hexameric protein [Ignavibacteriaceae bacterium]